MAEAPIESRLTPAAREAVDELVADYRDRIILRAHANAAQLPGDVREISVRDVLSAASSMMTPPGAGRQPLARAAQRFQLLGLILVFLSGVGFLVSRYSPAAGPLAGADMLLLAFGISGFAVAVLGLWVARRTQVEALRELLRHTAADLDRTELVGLFLARWSELESLVRAVAALEFGESVADAPVSVLMTRLIQKGFIDGMTDHDVRELLSLRNNLVHGRARIDPRELLEAIRRVDLMLERLRDLASRSA